MTPNSSLLQWLATFELDGQSAVEHNEDDAYYNLADGFVSARILNQISPQYFSDKWLDGIKPVAPNGSWRLRVSNLKRILQKIHDYASDLQSTQFRPSAITPDVAVIAQNFDRDQICRLIQLILFCAINSDKKEIYIEKISNLPTQVQQDIKEAIVELLIDQNDSYNQKLSTSHVGNDSVRSEGRDVESTTALGQRLGSISSQSTILSPSRSSAHRAILRRDSSQISSDTSRRNESHLDTSSNSTHDNLNETIDDVKQKLTAALAIKEEKAQACHDLELKIKQLQLEKDQLLYENEKLSNEKSSTKTPTSLMKTSDPRRLSQTSNRGVEAASEHREIENRLMNIDAEKSSSLIMLQNRKLQNELHKYKEEIIKIETEKEDYRLKSNLLKEDLDKVTMRQSELLKKAEQVKRLQDELDECRHISEKMINYEAMIENLKSKNNEMKKELKSLEEKNMANIHELVRLKEENSELTSALGRIEIYKQQLHEAQVKLSQEMHRADKAEVELSRLLENYSAARKENAKLHETTNQLMRSNSNILSQDNQKAGANSCSQTKNLDYTNLRGTSVSDKSLFDDYEARTVNNALSSLSTPVVDLREKIARLEYENEILQTKLITKRESDQSVLSGLLDSANARCAKLEVENRQSKKKVLQLELRLKDLMSQPNSASTSAMAHNDPNSDNTLALMNRVEELQRLLFQKEHELMDSETKYKKNLQKAKDVIKALNSNQSISGSLHPSCMLSSASPFNSNSLDETNLLKQQLKDREDRLIEMEREFTEFKKIKEIHERLMISAFYGLTTPMQWKNAEKRLERSTLTSPPNTASNSINHSKHSH